jgi:hypothetical protein
MFQNRRGVSVDGGEQILLRTCQKEWEDKGREKEMMPLEVKGP